MSNLLGNCQECGEMRPCDHTLDPRTGRPLGNHGTADQAIDFALDFNRCEEPDTFLRIWREGGTWEEWPEFYEWLREQEKQHG